MPLIAIRRTVVTLGTAKTVLTGSYRVHQIMIANATANPVTVTFTNADGGTEAVVRAAANDTFSCEANQLWDNGMVASAAGASITLTVAHSQDGV